MSRYLITGGCGFIGTHLAKKLAQQNHQIVIIDNFSNSINPVQKARIEKTSITDIDAVAPFFENCDGCFHLAAIPTVELELNQWLNLHEINLNGSLNIFKCAIDAGNIPTVFASSCSVYGNCNLLPLEESQYIEPLSSYACDKYASELNAHFLAHNYQLPITGLRLFNVYGPGQNPSSPYSGVITHFITNILQDKPVDIYGDGCQTRDFVFVEDVVTALIKTMSNIEFKSNIINICSNTSITINQLAELISNLIGKKCKKNYLPPRSVDVTHSLGANKKMTEAGIELKNSLEQGLAKTITYYRNIL
jgi:UDP-glucose 4-epimerase